MAPSDKITGKNLTYDQTLPPFLAALRGQHTGTGSNSPDPILAARRRHAKVRSASEEAEDAPVVVDEEGNVVDVKVTDDDDGEATANGNGNKNSSAEEEKRREMETAKEPEKVAVIGAGKKRKVGKVVGADEEEGEDAGGVDAAIRKAVKATQMITKRSDEKNDDAKPVRKMGEKGGKKKAKKIKLSFGDEG
ncbi:uncharacterized protein BCR38DRAFT_436528 [Pseudomassariella vexata]|uniref:DUF4604 domain-containing protein n=1 Tax=Pseudomassariella vexata TaxID=1141098 RepID=A0A1Y2DXH3_9PEZI|nr:uncharacterized protein BCR38DRAFT_436528 [Pseudomassariella vexata]ORY63325.1 hypothetical protein BCR38DRAFT_436528 [Pseudomassariella vexata]